jgi:hypothetical protein
MQLRRFLTLSGKKLRAAEQSDPKNSLDGTEKEWLDLIDYTAKPSGTCYRDVMNYIIKRIDPEDDAKLVHGKLKRIDKTIDHAWVKLGPVVWEPQLDKIVESKYFDKISTVDAEYTREEAILLTRRTDNYGPWTTAEVEAMRRAKAGGSSD